MKTKKKPVSIKHKIREERDRQSRISVIVTAVVLIVTILVSSYAVVFLLNNSTTDQQPDENSKPKAVIIDQESSTYPNQTFVNTATQILGEAGYTVDYFSGKTVTVDFYRALPNKGYNVVVMRVHSTAFVRQGSDFTEAPVSLFTSEDYSSKKYLLEQLYDQVVMASYVMPNGPYYFAITPSFVRSCMNGEFRRAAIIMMGCEGLYNTKMAQAFVSKGADLYIGWNRSPQAPYDDAATTILLQNLVVKKNTVKDAIEDTMKTCKDPSNSELSMSYFPIENGFRNIEDFKSSVQD